MSKLISNASRQVELAQHAFTNKAVQQGFLEKALNNLLDFVSNASFLKIVFNIKTIIKLIKEIVIQLKSLKND